MSEAIPSAVSRERTGFELLWLRVKSSRKATAALVEMTRLMEEHPEGWNGPCECDTCKSYEGVGYISKESEWR